MRTHEIGVRTALGAQPADVVATIGRRAAVQRAVGILVGMPLAGRLYYLIQEDPAAKGAAVVPGVGVLRCSRCSPARGRSSGPSGSRPTEAMRADG